MSLSEHSDYLLSRYVEEKKVESIKSFFEEEIRKQLQSKEQEIKMLELQLNSAYQRLADKERIIDSKDDLLKEKLKNELR
jgi:hypothetical protein